MPVVVTGASGLVGRALVRLLADRGGEVRAYVRRREAAEDLRTAGAKVAVGEALDEETLAAVMSGAHTVCHLIGGLSFPDPAAYERANLESTRAAVEAAGGAGAARFLFLSYPGASPASANPYLRAKGLAEEAVRGSGMEHLVLRSTHVYGPGSVWLEEMAGAALGPVATVVGSGRQRLAPVFVEDVARVLAAADDRAGSVGGTLGLQGPDVVTADELADLLAGRRIRKVHLAPGAARRAGRLLGRRYPLPMLKVLAGDSLADAPDAAAEFGVARTSLEDGLRRSR